MFTYNMYSQTPPNTKITSDGNYIAIIGKKEKSKPIATGKTYTDIKGVVYPVYKTSTGKLFINKVSKKTGKTYRYYLTIKNNPQ